MKHCTEAIVRRQPIAPPLAADAGRRSLPRLGKGWRVWLVASVVATSPTAHAQQTSNVGSPSPVAASILTELHVRTSATHFERLKSVIGEHTLGTLQLRWTRLQHLSASSFLDAPINTPAKVRCYIDLSRPNKATLYFADGTSRRFLYREIPISRAYDPVELETIAQIVELGVGALLDESTAALSRIEAEALLGSDVDSPLSSPETRSPNSSADAPILSSESPRLRDVSSPRLSRTYHGFLDLAAAFESRLREQGLATTVAAGGGLRIDQESSSFRFGARAAYLLPQTISNQWVSPTIDGYGAFSTLLGEKALTEERRLFAGLGITLGLERLHVRPRPGTLDQSTELNGPSWATIPIAAPSLHVEYRWGRNLVVSFDASLTVAARVITYQLQLPQDVTLDVLQTRTVRPAFQVSFGWN